MANETRIAILKVYYFSSRVEVLFESDPIDVHRRGWMCQSVVRTAAFSVSRTSRLHFGDLFVLLEGLRRISVVKAPNAVHELGVVVVVKAVRVCASGHQEVAVARREDKTN